MLKKIFLGALVLLVAASLFAGGGSDKSQGIVFRLNMSKNSQDPQYPLVMKFAEDVQKLTNGHIRVQVYPGEGLGRAVDVIEMASRGELVFADSDFNYMGSFAPDMSVLQSPYVLQDITDVVNVLKTPEYREMHERLRARGLHVLAANYEGPRILWTNRRITTRSDVAGLRLRAAPAPMWNAISEVLGGNPTNIPISETYSALQQGVVDGAEMSPPIAHSWKWHEVAKFATRTDHVMGITLLVMSSKVYNELAPDVRAGLDQAAENLMQEYLRLSDKLNEETFQMLRREGVTISDIDKADFIAAAQQIIPSRFPDWTPGIVSRLRASLDAMRR